MQINTLFHDVYTTTRQYNSPKPFVFVMKRGEGCVCIHMLTWQLSQLVCLKPRTTTPMSFVPRRISLGSSLPRCMMPRYAGPECGSPGFADRVESCDRPVTAAAAYGRHTVAATAKCQAGGQHAHRSDSEAEREVRSVYREGSAEDISGRSQAGGHERGLNNDVTCKYNVRTIL